MGHLESKAIVIERQVDIAENCTALITRPSLYSIFCLPIPSPRQQICQATLSMQPPVFPADYRLHIPSSVTLDQVPTAVLAAHMRPKKLCPCGLCRPDPG